MGTNPGDFTQNNTCSGVIAVGASCSINVTFMPSGTGVRSGSIVITDDSAGGDTQTISLTGTGITAPNVYFSYSTLNFDSQNLGISNSLNDTLLNNGSALLSISSIGITGTNPGDFSQTNNCGVSLAAGNDCTIVVTFKPTVVGARSASVSVTDNAGGSPQSISLTGTGTSTPTPPGSYTVDVSGNGGGYQDYVMVNVTVK
jgi:hypothetical protein